MRRTHTDRQLPPAWSGPYLVTAALLGLALAFIATL
jgi:hypothetical protein